MLCFPQCRLQSPGHSQEVIRLKYSHNSTKAPLVFYTKMMLQRAFFCVGKIIDPRQVVILHSYHHSLNVPISSKYGPGKMVKVFLLLNLTLGNIVSIFFVTKIKR